MAGRAAAAGATRAGGLLGSIKKLLTTVVAVVETRLELFANELQSEGRRFGQLVVWGVAALFFLAFGFVLLTFFVIAIFWDSNRLLAIGGFALAYVVIGGVFAAAVRGRVNARRQLFEASLGELRKDRDRLSA